MKKLLLFVGCFVLLFACSKKDKNILAPQMQISEQRFNPQPASFRHKEKYEIITPLNVVNFDSCAIFDIYYRDGNAWYTMPYDIGGLTFNYFIESGGIYLSVRESGMRDIINIPVWWEIKVVIYNLN